MNDEIHRFLDGELSEEELDTAGSDEVEAWDRLLEAFRVEEPARGVVAPPWLEDRVMAEIEALPAAGPARRLLDWILTPRPVRVSPLTAGLAAAALAVVLLLPGSGTDAPTMGPEGTTAAQGADAPVVYVQFRLEAPGATSVAVAGDFTGWTPSENLQDPDGDGVWTGRIPVRPGVYAYMFVVDESEWVTDPYAGRYQDDGFGSRNAVLAVAPPRT